MKKIATTAMLALAVVCGAIAGPTANAAGLDEVLASALAAQSPAAAKAQQIMAIKQEIEAGNKEALLGRVNQAILDRMGKSDLAPVSAAIIGGTDMRAVAETAVRREIADRVNAELSPYQSQLSTVDALLATAGITPASLQAALTGSQDYRQLIETALVSYLRKA